MTSLVSAYLAAFAGALALVPVCRWVAVRTGYVATPKADRWHQRHTALLGGVAIATVVLAGGWLGESTSHLPLVLASGLAVFLLGLVDDLYVLKPSTKLVGQVAVASLFVYFGYRLHWTESLTLDTMLTLFWVVGVTNAFNLLDNMDGLCAGIGLIVACALMVGFIQSGDVARARYLALVMGSLTGFLVYNFHPASIFMGDSGSLFIGFTLSTLALEPVAGHRAGTHVLAIIGAPLLVLLIPIFDTSLVTVLRLLSGRKPSQGGRDHSSHRLVAIGLPERTAVLVLWTLAALGGAIGLQLQFADAGLAGAAAALFVLAMIIFAVYLGRVRVYETADPALLLSGRITPFVDNLMHKRRAAEVLLDVCLVALAYYVAYRLRFEGEDFTTYFPQFLASLPIVLAVQSSILFLVGAYRGVWRYFGLMDAVMFAKGVAIGTVAIVTAVVVLYRFQGYSRGVFAIYAVNLMLALCSSRASFRLISEFVRRRRLGNRLVIYGAGAAGALLLRELLSTEHQDYRLLGFVDDDPDKQRTRLLGYPVLGTYATLEVLAAERAVDTIIVSAREMAGAQIQQLERLCTENGIALSRLHLRLEPLVAS